jgi:NADPH-dependent curcumin reductase CurA
MNVNRQWRLAARPSGMVRDSDFSLVEAPVPTPAEGEVLVRTLAVSCDPAQRGWMDDRPSYVPPVQLGEVMRAYGIGRVVAARAPGYAEGDLVLGPLGWQEYAVCTAGVTKLPPGLPPLLFLGVLGTTGITAYFGLLEIGRPVAGETVVVSAAAGATGSVAGQIARLKGCRTIGIAGGPEKCAWVVEQARFDAAIDYQREDVGRRLRELCPGGLDVYFDNVGGEILDAALANLARHARVVLCGGISGYNDAGGMRGPRNYLNLLVTRSRMEGFIILDYVARFPAAVAELAAWVAAGELRHEEDVVDGLEHAPAALRRLFEGRNRGKQIVRVAE